jgi:hypothetical protein
MNPPLLACQFLPGEGIPLKSRPFRPLLTAPERPINIDKVGSRPAMALLAIRLRDDAGSEDENSTPSIKLGGFDEDEMEENIFDDISIMLTSRAHRFHSLRNVWSRWEEPIEASLRHPQLRLQSVGSRVSTRYLAFGVQHKQKKKTKQKQRQNFRWSTVLNWL